MNRGLDIYDQMDWWNPRHSLVRMAGFKFGYFHEKIGPLDRARVLDVGCGGGLLSEEFARQGAYVTGIDPSEGSLRTAREHAAASGLQIRYEAGKAEQMPFDDGSFDAVVCADCLEHIDDLARVIREVSRVIENGGVFCYDTFNRNLLSKIVVAWILERHLCREYRSLNVSEHVFSVHDWNKFIKPKELIELMAQNRLVNAETKGMMPGRGGFSGFKAGGKPWIAYIGYAVKRR